MCILYYIYLFFYIFFFFFLKLRRNRPDTWSIPSHITPEPPKMIFGFKETDKRAKNGDKKRPKTL
jgi:hypothetical protein